jgi:hypothetical protein
MSQATLAVAACLFSGYLLYIQLAVVDAVCQWCLATDAITTASAAVALLRLRVVAATPPAAVWPSPKRHPQGRRSTKRKPKRTVRSR